EQLLLSLDAGDIARYHSACVSHLPMTKPARREAQLGRHSQRAAPWLAQVAEMVDFSRGQRTAVLADSGARDVSAAYVTPLSVVLIVRRVPALRAELGVREDA